MDPENNFYNYIFSNCKDYSEQKCNEDLNMLYSIFSWFQLPGYSCFHIVRDYKQSGGVALYVNIISIVLLYRVNQQLYFLKDSTVLFNHYCPLRRVNNNNKCELKSLGSRMVSKMHVGINKLYSFFRIETIIPN